MLSFKVLALRLLRAVLPFNQDSAPMIGMIERLFQLLGDTLLTCSSDPTLSSSSGQCSLFLCVSVSLSVCHCAYVSLTVLFLSCFTLDQHHFYYHDYYGTIITVIMSRIMYVINIMNWKTKHLRCSVIYPTFSYLLPYLANCTFVMLLLCKLSFFLLNFA